MDLFAQSRRDDDLFADEYEPVVDSIAESSNISEFKYPDPKTPKLIEPALTPESNSAKRQTKKAVSGDRSLTGGISKVRLTEEELSEKLERMRVINADKLEKHLIEAADQAAFEFQDKNLVKEAQKREERERAQRLEMEKERMKNRERKIKSIAGREWDIGKEDSYLMSDQSLGNDFSRKNQWGSGPRNNRRVSNNTRNDQPWNQWVKHSPKTVQRLNDNQSNAQLPVQTPKKDHETRLQTPNEIQEARNCSNDHSPPDYSPGSIQAINGGLNKNFWPDSSSEKVQEATSSSYDHWCSDKSPKKAQEAISNPNDHWWPENSSENVQEATNSNLDDHWWPQNSPEKFIEATDSLYNHWWSDISVKDAQGVSYALNKHWWPEDSSKNTHEAMDSPNEHSLDNQEPHRTPKKVLQETNHSPINYSEPTTTPKKIPGADDSSNDDKEVIAPKITQRTDEILNDDTETKITSKDTPVAVANNAPKNQLWLSDWASDDPYDYKEPWMTPKKTPLLRSNSPRDDQRWNSSPKSGQWNHPSQRYNVELTDGWRNNQRSSMLGMRGSKSCLKREEAYTDYLVFGNEEKKPGKEAEPCVKIPSSLMKLLNFKGKKPNQEEEIAGSH